MNNLFKDEEIKYIPFIVTESKSGKIVFDSIEERNIIYELPKEPVVDYIDFIKRDLSYYGYLNLTRGAYLLDIITDAFGNGWPGFAKVAFTDNGEKGGEYRENLFIGFCVDYDPNTLELVEISGLCMGIYNGDEKINSADE